MKRFEPIEREVKIQQKIVKNRPVDKLMDGYTEPGMYPLVETAESCLELNEAKR